MRKVKSYSSVWGFERVLHKIGDVKSPIPLTFAQIGWLVGTFLVDMLILAKIPPLCYVDNVIIRYVLLPVGVTWFMSKKAFDGKRPYSYLRSVLFYLMRPHVTYAGRKVVYGKEKIEENVTIARCELYVPSKIY